MFFVCVFCVRFVIFFLICRGWKSHGSKEPEEVRRNEEIYRQMRRLEEREVWDRMKEDHRGHEERGGVKRRGGS